MKNPKNRGVRPNGLLSPALSSTCGGEGENAGALGQTRPTPSQYSIERGREFGGEFFRDEIPARDISFVTGFA